MAILFKLPQHTLLAGIPPAPAVGSSLGDDSDSWWAGAQRCFMAIPIAATLATVALSASLCWGAQQQNEEIVPQPAATALAGDEWIQPPVQKQASWTRVWSVDDEIVPQVVTVVEEDGWQPPPSLRPVVSAPVWQTDEEVIPHVIEEYWHQTSPPRPVILAQVWQTDEEVIPHVNDEYWHQTYSVRHGITRSGPEWDDQVPSGSLFGQPEDYPWTVYSPPYAPPKFLYLPDPENLPAGSLFGVPEDYPWTVYSPPYAAPKFLYLPDPEELPSGSLFGVPDEPYWVPLGANQPRLNTQVWSVTDEIVPQAAGFTPEEAYQPVQLAQPQATWKKLWVGNESVVAPPVIDESSWVGYTPSRALPTLLPLWVDDEIIPQAAALTLEDDAWPLPTPRPQPVQVQVWSVTDEIVPQAAGFTPEEDYQPVQLAQPQASWKKLWVADESVVVPPVIDESYWVPARVSRPLTPQPLVWVDEEIVPQAAGFTPEEAYQPVQLAQPQASWRKLWVGNESVVQPQVPLEESAWTPPLVRPVTQTQVWWGDDEIVPQAAGFTPEEAYQPVLLAQPQASWRKLWVADESVVVPPVIDEPYWVPAWVSRPLTPQSLVWADDEIVPQAAALTHEGDAWVTPQILTRLPVRTIWLGEDETVQAPANFFLEDDSGFPTVKFIPNRVPLALIAVTVDNDSRTQAVAPTEIMTWYYIPHTVRNSC